MVVPIKKPINGLAKHIRPASLKKKHIKPAKFRKPMDPSSNMFHISVASFMHAFQHRTNRVLISNC